MCAFVLEPALGPSASVRVVDLLGRLLSKMTGLDIEDVPWKNLGSLFGDQPGAAHFFTDSCTYAWLKWSRSPGTKPCRYPRLGRKGETPAVSDPWIAGVFPHMGSFQLNLPLLVGDCQSLSPIVSHS